MAGRKKAVTRNTDKAQSDQFRKTAEELEADGSLDLTEASEKLERMVKSVTPSRSPSK